MLEIPRYSPFDTPKSNDELYIEIENILNNLEATLAIFELEQDKTKARQVGILIYELKNQQTLINAENHKKVGKLTKREKIENLLSQAREILQGNESSLSRFDLERESEISHIPLPPEELEAKYFSKEDIAVSNALLAFNITELFSEEEFETRIIIDSKQTGKNDNHKIQEAVELVTDFLIDNQTLNYFCENAEFATTQTAINMPPDLLWIKEKNPAVWQAINTLVKSKKGPEFLRLLAGQPTHNTAVEETDQYDLMAKESLDASPNILSLAINISRQRLKSSARQDLSEAEKNVLVNLYGADFLKDAEEERARDIIFTQLLAQILNEDKNEKNNESIIQLIDMLEWRDIQKMLKNNDLKNFESILKRIAEYLPNMTDEQVKMVLEKMNTITKEALAEPDKIQKRKDDAQKRKEKLEQDLEEAQKNGDKKILMFLTLGFFGSRERRIPATTEKIEDVGIKFLEERKNYQTSLKLLFLLLKHNGNIAKELTKKEDWEKRNKEFADFCIQILYLYSKLQKYPSYREDTKDGNINNFDGFVTSYIKVTTESKLPTDKELNLNGASLVGADFRKADLSKINLEGADVTNANFEGADFSKMTNKQIEGAKFNREDDNIPKWIKYGLDEEGKFSKQKLQETIREKSKTETIDLQDAKLMGLDLSNLNLSNANFRNSNLSRVIFTNTILMGADFRGAHIESLQLANTNLEGAKFDKETINPFKKTKLANESNYRPESVPKWIQQALDTEGKFSKKILADNIKKDKKGEIKLNNADLSGLSLNGVDFSGREITGTKFIGTNLEESKWNNCILTNVDFSDANLYEADFRSTSFKNVNLEGARFETIKIKDSNNIPPWIRYGLDNPGRSGKYSKKDLIEYIKRHSTLNLRNADLPGIDLSKFELNGALFSGANLEGAIFTNCLLKKTEFASAQLENASFRGSILEESDFANANLRGANFSGADLKDVKNLDGAYTPVRVGIQRETEYFNSNLVGANFSNAKNIPPHIQERLDENGIYH
ncbi:MAG: pentapeptide repeat-containing protein [Candidatus Magasanikbacteria bacterium]